MQKPTDLPTLFFSDRYRKQTISFFRPKALWTGMIRPFQMENYHYEIQYLPLFL